MKTSPHTQAVQMASDNIKKVVSGFGQHRSFMQTTTNQTANRNAMISSTPETAGLQEQGYSQEFLGRLAKVAQNVAPLPSPESPWANFPPEQA